MQRRERDRAEREARENLERLGAEGDLLGSSAIARATERAQRHFGAADAPPGDFAELWGRRIGRVFALMFVIFLIVWLINYFS